MTGSVVIPGRFNGPPTSANGGYCCGLLAAHVHGTARVRLHSPPPLDTPMQVESNQDGHVELRLKAQLVASARPGSFTAEVPNPPSLEEAASAAQRFAAYESHIYPGCFVCGVARGRNDGLNLHPGPVRDWSLLACTWQPGSDLLDRHGSVRDEITWSALDCPGYFAAAGPDLPGALLGELCAELRSPVPGSETLVVYSWPIGTNGRKIFGGTAIARGDGEVLAASHSTWIVLRQD